MSEQRCNGKPGAVYIHHVAWGKKAGNARPNCIHRSLGGFSEATCCNSGQDMPRH
jgi:hypothetical protein